MHVPLGDLPLYTAAAEGNVELVNLFVTYGADLSHHDDKFHRGGTALHYLIRNCKFCPKTAEPDLVHCRLHVPVR